MKTIGITGGIGSGKSTVARMLKVMGFPVYISDTEASRLMDTHAGIRQEICRQFGRTIYSPQGKLDRAALAGIIFRNPDSLAAVNRIVHPRVMEDFRQWSLAQHGELLFFESAILFECGLDRFFDAVICVTAPETLRMQRVGERDGASPKQFRARQRNQTDDSAKCAQSDFVIYNDNRHMLTEQLSEILPRLHTFRRI